MKVRILSGLAGLLLLLVVIFSNTMVLGLAVFILSLIAINEIYNAFINAEKKPIKIIGFISCLPLLILTFDKYLLSMGYLFNIKLLFVYIFVLFLAGLILMVFKFEKYDYTDIALTYFGIFYVTVPFSFLILTRNLENGLYFIWLILIGAWLTDSAAYFTGYSLGKHKILPTVSPKKTLEGSIGGIIGCVLCTLIFGIFIFNRVYEIDIYHYVILGLLNGLFSQTGDWIASAMKRKVNIKDFGNLMPGHGGVIDRFDSILIIGPIVYFYVTFFIL